MRFSLLLVCFVCLVVQRSAIPASAQTASPANADPKTVIESDYLELVTTEDENRFLFTGQVKVRATNMEASCDRMEVIANRTEDSDPSATLGEIGSIDMIIAEGNVVVTQAGRTAEAGRAEIFPKEGRVLLMDNPKITDERGAVATGPVMELLQGERKARIRGLAGQPIGEGERPKVVLPSIPDLGFDESAEVAHGDEAPETVPAADEPPADSGGDS